MSGRPSDKEDFAPQVKNPNGHHAIVLVCEHASRRIPEPFKALGLDEAARKSHIAWDPGAFDVASVMSHRLDAPLVYSTASRLLYDCNRPPEARDAIPEQSEDTVIPGNLSLTPTQSQDRIDRFYRPFEGLLSDTLDRSIAPVLVTIHSFTPIFRGVQREVEIGILHDEDPRLADTLLSVAQGFKTARNAPYGPEDGVTHTLRRHALPRGLPNVMIEVRNDLLATPQQRRDMADTLSLWLSKALVAQQTVAEGA